MTTSWQIAPFGQEALFLMGCGVETKRVFCRGAIGARKARADQMAEV